MPEGQSLLQRDGRIGAILNFLLSIRGIRKVRLLSDEERRVVLELEREAEKRVLMGLIPGVNLGVREALSRDFTVAAITQDEFEWPRRGLIKIMCDDEVLGEDVRGQEELEGLKREGHKVIANYIVIYKDKYDKFKSLGGFRGVTLVLAPLELEWTKEVPNARRVVVGSPSQPADAFLKKLMGLEEERGRLGSILIGFDLNSNSS